MRTVHVIQIMENRNLNAEILILKGRIIKANLSWSRTRAKFCQLTARLSVTLLQFKLKKLKTWVPYFQRKKEIYGHR